MGVTIIPPRGIAVSGVTVENEPIIKSDGAGEVMQWQPSDGGADGVFVEQVSGIDGLCLGVGGTPTAKLEVQTNYSGAQAYTDAHAGLLIENTHASGAAIL